MLDELYKKHLADMDLEVNKTYLNDDKNTKLIEITDNTNSNIDITKIRNNIKKQINNKKKQSNTNYDEEKTLIDTILHIDNSNIVESYKQDTRERILTNFDYYKIFNECKNMTFEREKITRHKPPTNDGYLNQIISALIVNKNVYYPILKLNKMIHNITLYINIAHKVIKTSNYLIPRTELYLMDTNYDLIETYKYETIMKLYIDKAKVKPIEIFLYAFQQVLTTNEKVLGMTKYTTQKVYEYDTDFTSNYLYYSTDTHILRFKLLYIITLEQEQLPFTDLNYYLFKIRWINQNPINSNSNFVVVVKLDVFFRNTNLLKPNQPLTIQHTKDKPTKPHKILQNLYNSNNQYGLYYNIRPIVAELNAPTYLCETALSNKIKNMLDTPNLTQTQIDELFNPKRLNDTEESKKQHIYKSVLYSSSENDSDSDEEEQIKQIENIKKPQKRLSEPHTQINNSVVSGQDRLFNLIFKYNKHYTFNSDEKYLITNAFINKYNTNKKLQSLTSDYEVIMIIKPTNKHYTYIRYFNFILTTHDYTYFTKQYHAYLDQNDNITNITEITEYIKNVV